MVLSVGYVRYASLTEVSVIALPFVFYFLGPCSWPVCFLWSFDFSVLSFFLSLSLFFFLSLPQHQCSIRAEGIHSFLDSVFGDNMSGRESFELRIFGFSYSVPGSRMLYGKS